MEFAFVAAVRGVGFEDIAVAGFESPVNAGFVDNAGATEFAEVFAQKCVGLTFRHFVAFVILFTG